MSDMKHTPGGWSVQPISDEGEERGTAFIVADDLGGLVGAALPWPTEIDSGDFSRVEANAYLMGAAPDLLAACKALYATHRQGKGQCCTAADMAIDAIDKAEGRQP